MAGLILCLLASVFFSITDSALSHFTHAGLRQLAGDGPRLERVEAHLQHRHSYQLVCFVLNAVANILFVILLVQYLLMDGHSTGRVIAALGWSGLFVLVLGEVVPRAWGQGNADRWLVRLLPVLRVVSTAAWPLVAVLRLVVAAVGRLTGSPMEEVPVPAISEEIRSVVSEGEKRGDLEEGEKEMIESIFELHDVDAAEIMTPRTDMVCIDATASLDEISALAVESGYSRIPVFEHSRDNILGIVHVKDLLRPANVGRTAREVAQKPYFVPETKLGHELLHELRAQQGHMAVVLDEYGGTAGLVTLEDILEEIVGEIEDEYDEEPTEPLQQVDEHTLECEASLLIDDLEDALEVELPQDEGYDTVAGFVTAQLGHIPQADETYTWQNIQFRILEATERKISRLRVTVLPDQDIAKGE
jgi:CBS domain containing-hemolysin-like protein